MKKLFLTIGLLLCVCSVDAATYLTLKLTVTNAPAALTNGTLVLNGSTRTWTNTATPSTSQLQITNSTANAAYVLWANAVQNSYGAGLIYSLFTNTFQITGGANVTITTNGAYLPWGYMRIYTNSSTADLGNPVLVDTNTMVLSGSYSNFFMANTNLLLAASPASVGVAQSQLWATNSALLVNLTNQLIGVSNLLSATKVTTNASLDALLLNNGSGLTGLIVNAKQTTNATLDTLLRGDSTPFTNLPTGQVFSNTGPGVTVYKGPIGGGITNAFATEGSFNSGRLSISTVVNENIWTINGGYWFDGESGHSIYQPTITGGGTITLGTSLNALNLQNPGFGYLVQIQLPDGSSTLVLSNAVGLNDLAVVGMGLIINGSRGLTAANAGANGVLTNGATTITWVTTNGSPTGVRGDAARPYDALSNALAFAQNGDVILLGPGTFVNGTNTLSVTQTNLTVAGQGSISTVLYWPPANMANDGFSVSGQSFSLLNLAIVFTNNTSPTANPINLNAAGGCRFGGLFINGQSDCIQGGGTGLTNYISQCELTGGEDTFVAGANSIWMIQNSFFHPFGGYAVGAPAPPRAVTAGIGTRIIMQSTRLSAISTNASQNAIGFQSATGSSNYLDDVNIMDTTNTASASSVSHFQLSGKSGATVFESHCTYNPVLNSGSAAFVHLAAEADLASLNSSTSGVNAAVLSTNTPSRGQFLVTDGTKTYWTSQAHPLTNWTGVSTSTLQTNPMNGWVKYDCILNDTVTLAAQAIAINVTTPDTNWGGVLPPLTSVINPTNSVSVYVRSNEVSKVISGGGGTITVISATSVSQP